MYVSHFFYVDDNGKVTLDAFQIMHNMLCYLNHVFSFNQKTKLKKSLISYYKTSGITYLRKHIDANHSKNKLKIQQEVNFAMVESFKRHHAKYTKYS
jgi:hypothetical protein